MSASKSDLIKNVAYRLNMSEAEAARSVDAVLDGISTWAKDDKLIIRGFGTFEMKTRAARTGRNPQTGLPVEIPASTSLTFKAAKSKA
ncbi:MAG: HU family DNA-binding protein [Tabrizicola flagellatus]|uniref:HU family DNA-binding protein n=1 Tax=Tabrizicola flagellatus TaxID=2593021 RepID=UPI0039196B03